MLSRLLRPRPVTFQQACDEDWEDHCRQKDDERHDEDKDRDHQETLSRLTVPTLRDVPRALRLPSSGLTYDVIVQALGAVPRPSTAEIDAILRRWIDAIAVTVA